MGWLSTALLVLSFGTPLGIITVPYFLLSRIGKFYVKAMAFTIKATIGIIAYPFKLLASLLGGSFHALELFYYQGVFNAKRGGVSKDSNEDGDSNVIFSAAGSLIDFLTKYKFRYIGLLIFIFWVFNYPQMIATVFVDPSRMSVSWLIDVLPMIFILSLPFIITIVVSAISFEFFGDGDKFWKASDQAVRQAKKLGAPGAAAVGAAGAAAAGVGQKARDAKELGESAVTTASEIKKAGEALGGEGAAAEGAAAEGAVGLEALVADSAVAGALGEALPVVAVLVIVWIVYTFIAGLISLFLVGLTWIYIAKLIPVFAGFIMPILGLGNAYGQWIGQSTANTLGPQIDGIFEEEVRMLKQGFAKVGCFAKGPQCIRQWRMNNTVRPGSDAEGESYELRIVEFGLGTDRIDKAYKEANYTLPVSFLVENTRHGLKGIRARNVDYKIDVESFDETHCTTGWKSIDTFPNQEDKDYILPGLGVSPTDEEDIRNLTLGNCDLLQASMGRNRVMTLAVKYDYSSQATLYVDAVSRKYRREKGIMPSFKKSRTARTPVQSYINVKAPITFFETQNGREAVPFTARFGFETPGYDVEYKVHPDSVDIRDSSRTTHVENNCQGLEYEGRSEYRVSDEAENRINLRQENRWFNKNVDPSPLRCIMKIEDGSRPDIDNDLGLISPTGQQLVMRIDGNYTVKREKQMANFDIWNTHCQRINCPMVVTKEYNDTSEYELFSECKLGNSVDARGGCVIRVPEISGENAGDIDWQVPRIAERNGKDIVIDQGETARRWNEVEGEIDNAYPSGRYREAGDSSSVSSDNSAHDVIGLDEEEFQSNMESTTGMAVYMRETSSGLGDLRFRQVRYSVCEEAPNLGDFVSTWKEYNGIDDVVDIRVDSKDCSEMLSELSTSADCPVDLASEVIQTGTGWNAIMEGGGITGDTYTACDQISDLVSECGSGQIKAVRNGRIRCYG